MAATNRPEQDGAGRRHTEYAGYVHVIRDGRVAHFLSNLAHVPSKAHDVSLQLPGIAYQLAELHQCWVEKVAP